MIAGLLLAAGGARRFGSQKLVAPLSGEPLVRRAATTLTQGVDATYVVIGHEAAAVREALAGLPVTMVENPRWSEGLSTSLCRGVSELPATADAVVIMLGDEPHTDVDAIRAVIDCWRADGKPIVVTRYDGTRGHPVLFARSMFEALASARGDAGARDIIERSRAHVAFVDVSSPMPADVDTPEDLDRVQRGIDGTR
jgi:molybdenum cofactor cytidylyltransferase